MIYGITNNITIVSPRQYYALLDGRAKVRTTSDEANELYSNVDNRTLNLNYLK